jgi:hypothetical protein
MPLCVPDADHLIFNPVPSIAWSLCSADELLDDAEIY